MGNHIVIFVVILKRNNVEAKLIKTEKQYVLQNKDGIVIASSFEGGKLSLHNCQAIECGYDLDELSRKETEDCLDKNKISSLRIGYHKGFQKAIDIVGDKKFNKEDMVKAMQFALDKYHYLGLHTSKNGKHPTIDNYLNSIEKTEWNVKIEMEPCFYDDSLGGFSTSYKEGMPKEQPKLDSKGCLILRRI